VLGPSLSVSEQLLNTWMAAALWAWQHCLELGASLVLFGVLWWRRRDLLDAVAVAYCRWFPGRTWQHRVRRTLWVLERRGRWSGRPRRASQTIPTWLRATLPEPLQPDIGLGQLTRMAEWATYAPQVAPPWKEGEVQDVCFRVLSTWPLGRWRRAFSARALRGV
jgi:hypothetical protein